MARRIRRDAPGCWHHVTNRALGSRTLFERRRDVRYFLSRVARAVRRGQIRVHAFCLLMTHFHLLVESSRGELDRAMARVQCEYSGYFNRARGRDGPLFRGRYWCQRADSVVYRRNVVRYIDANAVKAGLVPRPEWHPASSAHWYCHAEKSPSWLTRDWVERQVRERAGRREFRVEDYREQFQPALSADFEDWIGRRLASGETGPDPLEDLIDAVPARVLAWMIGRAGIADGSRIGIPLLPADSLERAREAFQHQFETLEAGRPGSHDPRISLASVAQAGLLADVAGLTQRQASVRAGLSRPACHVRIQRHRELLERQGDYARVVAGVVHLALQRFEQQVPDPSR